MKNKGQALIHVAWGVAVGTASILVYYFSAQAGLQKQISDLNTSTSSEFATENAIIQAQSGDIDYIKNQLNTVNQNILQIGEYAGAKHLQTNIATS